MLMVHLKMVELKSYSQSLPIAEDNTADALPVVKSLHYTTILNVAPFPFIPDLSNDNHRSLIHYIEEEFYKQHPDILLVLRPMNASDPFYDVGNVTNWLSGNGSVYDVVEIDTIILGDLVDAGVITPIPIRTSDIPRDWHPAAASAIQINNAVYAYPHLMCTFFLFTREDSIASASTVDELVQAIRKVSIYQGGYLPGNLNSTWDLTALYIDSYRETNFPFNLPDAEALHGAWNLKTLESLRKLGQLCNNINDQNPCLDGHFDEFYDEPAQYFGLGQVKAMFGYSERLHYILKYAQQTGPIQPSEFKIKPLPLGGVSNQPLFFTDAYVLRRNMPLDTARAAHLFIQFMASPAMQAAVAASEKQPGTSPPYRYLLPISDNAYSQAPLNTDHFYQTYFRNLPGNSLPNTGFAKRRKALGTYVADYMRKKY